MGWMDRVASMLGYQKAQLNNVPEWLQAEATWAQYDIPDRALPDAQLELYQRLSWMQIAVERTAETAAPTPFNVKQLDGEESEHIKNHPFEMLYRRPNPLMSRFEFNVATFSYYRSTGNAYWWLSKSNPNAAPDEMWVLPANKVKPVPDGRMFLKGYVYEPDAGQVIPLETHEVVHFRRWHPNNSFVGLSPVEAFAIDAEADLAMQKWNRNLFAKDNAKLPGALAFSDPIDDASWQRMKAEINREHGGTSRKLMMLRNVGKGVSWVPMAVSQRDMEFLAGRQFTKEEIFSIYAPGLASLLDVNATEANSTAGKATFIEMAVWPLLVQIAEKVTNDVLPLYGDNLVGEFEDIRVVDRQMKLMEIGQAEKFHTIDEIRQQFYNARPIGDERGKLLVAEVSKAPLVTMPEAEMPQEQQPPQLEQQPPRQITQVDEPEDVEDVDTSEVIDESLVRAERKTFKAWLKKRPSADVHEFKAKYLSHDELHEIADDVRGDAVKANRFIPRGDDEPNSPIPDSLIITDDDIEYAISKWDNLFPDFRGLLEAETAAIAGE